METILYMTTDILFINNMIKCVFRTDNNLTIKFFIFLLVTSFIGYTFLPNELMISVYLILIICLFQFKSKHFFKNFIGSLLMYLIFIQYVQFLFLSVTSSYIYDISQATSLTPTVFISDSIVKVFISLLIITFTHTRDFKIPRIYYLYFYILDITAIGTLYFMYINSFMMSNVFTKNVIMLFSFLIFVLNYIGIYLFNLAKEYILKYNESQLISAINEMRLHNYKEVEANQNEVRKIRHDLKNKIIVLKYLLNEKKYNKANELIQLYSEEIMIRTSIIDTGNTIIDALFNTKITAYKNINFILNLKIEDNSKIQVGDLIALIGNLIDNACECIDRDFKSGDLKVSLVISEEMFLLKISNPYKILKTEGDKILTLKKDSYNHGIGLKSVKMIVSNYKGTLDINTDNNMFTIKIVIY